MVSSEIKKVFFNLVRLGVNTSDELTLNQHIDWEIINTLAANQGLTAVVLDGIQRVAERHKSKSKSIQDLPQLLKLEWIGEAMMFDSEFKEYKRAIASLAGFYHEHGFKMMILKGYACSMDWPKPEHRPIGDIDIWLFGKQRVADEVLAQETGVEVDHSHHHHTVFLWQNYMVENHYDFINVHHHRSNVELDRELKKLAEDDTNYVNVNGERVIIPSPNFHAFFLLRHAMNHFASEVITLRHLLDWAFFAKIHREEIDWDWLHTTLNRHGLTTLYSVFNAILDEDLGFELCDAKGKKLAVSVDGELKERILNELLTPEFNDEEPNGILPRALFKYRRWKANEWKHKLCYNDSMWSAFWCGVWSHVLKPDSI